MSFTDEQKQILGSTLDPKNVSSRKNYGGSGNLSYLKSWFVVQEANRIFGFDKWSRETLHIERVATTPYIKKGKNGYPDTDMIAISYMARVRITVGDIVREGCGYGDGQAAADKAGSAHELALKEAESDAMKRAFMTFGNPFGLALYDKDQKNVAPPPPPTPLRRSKADSRDDYARIQGLIDNAASLVMLQEAWGVELPNIKTMHADFIDEITQRKDDKKHELNQQAA